MMFVFVAAARPFSCEAVRRRRRASGGNPGTQPAEWRPRRGRQTLRRCRVEDNERHSGATFTFVGGSQTRCRHLPAREEQGRHIDTRRDVTLITRASRCTAHSYLSDITFEFLYISMVSFLNIAKI